MTEWQDADGPPRLLAVVSEVARRVLAGLASPVRSVDERPPDVRAQAFKRIAVTCAGVISSSDLQDVADEFIEQIQHGRLVEFYVLPIDGDLSMRWTSPEFSMLVSSVWKAHTGAWVTTFEAIGRPHKKLRPKG